MRIHYSAQMHGLALGVALSLTGIFATHAEAVMTGWDVGWNNMATVSGGTVTPVVNPDTGSLRYVNVGGANVSFATYDMFSGFFGPNVAYSWADAAGDQGQHFFDGAIRNDWYGGSVPALTAADWDGSVGVPAAGTYEWLLNNYTRDGQGNPVSLKNSWIRGTDSSFTYDETTGEFIANMTSDGTWYWYTTTTPDSQMSGWIQNWDWSWDAGGDFADYYDRYMTGNFRLVGSFGDEQGLPVLTGATLQYEVAQAQSVPDGGASLFLLGLALAPLAALRQRKR